MTELGELSKLQTLLQPHEISKLRGLARVHCTEFDTFHFN